MLVSIEVGSGTKKFSSPLPSPEQSLKLLLPANTYPMGKPRKGGDLLVIVKVNAAATVRSSPATPRPIVGDHLYREWKSWGSGQVMKVAYQSDTYEVFARESCDGSDSASPVFKNGKYFLSWHVATMLLSNGYYSILPYKEGWSAQFTDRQIHLLFSALKEMESKVPWGTFVRQMNNFRANEKEKGIFSRRLASIHLPQEEWIGVY